MPDLKVLIFDVDGTLADTEETHRLAFNLSFREFGLEWEWTPKLYAELLSISGGRERMHAYANSLGESFTWPNNASEYFRELHQLKTAHYAQMVVAGNVPLRPGVRRLIAEARGCGIRLAIATSSRRSNLNALLDNNLDPNWVQWFDVIASCDEIEEKKPSPAVYEYVLQELAVSPDAAIAIEDTENGNLAAQAAGLNCVITTHYFTRNGYFPGAALVVDHLGEPDHAFHPMKGECWDAQYVDVALLRQILNHASESRHGSMGKNAA